MLFMALEAKEKQVSLIKYFIIYSMKFIQDDRVPLLFVGKWLDLKCWIQVDAIISNLKPSVPRNLANLIA